MTVKEIAIHTIEDLPEEASWADIQERINFVAGIHKGLQELDEGKGIPHYCVIGADTLQPKHQRSM
jgi:hypothetical protein